MNDLFNFEKAVYELRPRQTKKVPKSIKDAEGVPRVGKTTNKDCLTVLRI